MNKRNFSGIRFLLVAVVTGIAGCYKQSQRQITVNSTPAPVVKSDACPTISNEHKKDLRKAVEIKRRLVTKILRSNAKLKSAKLDIKAYVDLECKFADAPGAFVNVAGDYVPHNNPRQRLIVDGVVKKYSDEHIKIDLFHKSK